MLLSHTRVRYSGQRLMCRVLFYVFKYTMNFSVSLDDGLFRQVEEEIQSTTLAILLLYI